MVAIGVAKINIMRDLYDREARLFILGSIFYGFGRNLFFTE